MSTDNYYRILGVSTAATSEEIRRAYRVLARRYHPDVNPGKRSEERFKQIAEAYSTLSDVASRKQYDIELERSSKDSFGSAFDRAHEAYRRQHRGSSAQQQQRQQHTHAKTARPSPKSASHTKGPQSTTRRQDDRGEKHVGRVVRLSREAFKSIRQRVAAKVSALDRAKGAQVAQISIIEISVSIFEAIRGIRRTVELSDEGGKPRKISVTIPPGVRSGSVVRCRRKEDASEEVVLIVRVAAHPWISISHKGLLMEIPITISEALQGARIQVPSLAEPLLVTVEPGTQSGTEVRLRNQGVIHRDGTRGDLFVRFMIKVPDSLGAVGLTDKANEIDRYYAQPLRAALPKSLLEG